MRQLLPEGASLWTPYGATECLPVAVVEGRELTEFTRAAHRTRRRHLVGRVVAPNQVRIIRISDEAHSAMERRSGDADRRSRRNHRGRADRHRALLQSSGCRSHRQDQATAQRTVHRMGDLGYFDARAACGCAAATRSAWRRQRDHLHRTGRADLQRAPAVFRTALVGVGARPAEEPVLIIELEPGIAASRTRSCRRTAGHRPHPRHTRRIDTVLYYPGFPVDIRHNAKIGREQLAVWAAKNNWANST